MLERQREGIARGIGAGPLQRPCADRSATGWLKDDSFKPSEIASKLENGLSYLTSAIRALPTMTSGIPLVNSRTLFLTQSAAFSLEANASSALSNMLMVISTSRPPSSR